MLIRSDYLHILFDPVTLQNAVKKAMEALKGIEFDAIIVTGNSGTIFGGALSLALMKPLVLVRKARIPDGAHYPVHHSDMDIEGPWSVGRWIFVDDFMASGKTQLYVKRKMKEVYPGAKMIGSYFYRDEELFKKEVDLETETETGMPEDVDMGADAARPDEVGPEMGGLNEPAVV